MHSWLVAILVAVVVAPRCHAQWKIERSNTTADLRGIHNLGGGVAWASGASGVVLRTRDGGETWQSCSVPPSAEHLDFRGIQARDERTAIVMSAGKGNLSRIYKTTDACKTWELLFTNPDEEGFWDALLYQPEFDEIFVLGDPIEGSFALYFSSGTDRRWLKNWNGRPLRALPGQTLFAASNSILIRNAGRGQFSFVTGGSYPEIVHEEDSDSKRGTVSEWSRNPLPLASGETSGAFSIATAPDTQAERGVKPVVVVGGDYKHPDQRYGTAAFSTDSGYTFSSAKTPPNGYRSAVAYDPEHKFWISVGPNGTDISRDNGRNWYRLGPSAGDAPGSDKEWNALSLPFAVGPHGRIGELRQDAPELKRNRVAHLFLRSRVR